MCFSRAQIENYRVEDDVYSVGLDAIDIMKRNGAPGQKGTGNDLGEIMLYVFLEQVLGAPKIMSKVELQTGAKQYESKCDGIHLLSLEQTFGIPYYHMVFGTSSIMGDMKKSGGTPLSMPLWRSTSKARRSVSSQKTQF